MGIGNSKLNAAEGGEEVSDKTRSMLVGRFEEVRKRMNRDNTLSRKKLFVEEDINSESSGRTVTEDKISSLKEPPKEETETETRVITAEKLSRVVPMLNSECDIVEEENHPTKDNTEQVNKDMHPNQDTSNHAVEIAVKEVKTDVEETKKEKEQEVGAKGDDHDSDNEEVDRFLCRGSPSFRIYCNEVDKTNEEECNCPTPTIIVHHKSRSADSVETTKSTNSNEEVLQEPESTSKRKGHKKKFGAMKTLLKVKSLYHPMCTCTGDDKSLIVSGKATK